MLFPSCAVGLTILKNKMQKHFQTKQKFLLKRSSMIVLLLLRMKRYRMKWRTEKWNRMMRTKLNNIKRRF